MLRLKSQANKVQADLTQQLLADTGRGGILNGTFKLPSVANEPCKIFFNDLESAPMQTKKSLPIVDVLVA